MIGMNELNKKYNVHVSSLEALCLKKNTVSAYYAKQQLDDKISRLQHSYLDHAMPHPMPSSSSTSGHYEIPHVNPTAAPPQCNLCRGPCQDIPHHFAGSQPSAAPHAHAQQQAADAPMFATHGQARAAPDDVFSCVVGLKVQSDNGDVGTVLRGCKQADGLLSFTVKFEGADEVIVCKESLIVMLERCNDKQLVQNKMVSCESVNISTPQPAKRRQGSTGHLLPSLPFQIPMHPGVPPGL
jgi:hypothetical protein